MSKKITEANKDKHELLKIKLDLIKQFFTTLLVIDAGLVGFFFLNFQTNTLFINISTAIGVVCISVIFGILLKKTKNILNEMKGLLS